MCFYSVPVASPSSEKPSTSLANVRTANRVPTIRPSKHVRGSQADQPIDTRATRGDHRRLFRVLRMPALDVVVQRYNGGECLATDCARGFAAVHLHVSVQRLPVAIHPAAVATGAARRRRLAERWTCRPEAGAGLATRACNRAAQMAQPDQLPPPG